MVHAWISKSGDAARRAVIGAVLLLGACSGDDRAAPAPAAPPPPPPATYTVGGSVSGLDGSLTLLNNGGDARTVAANGNFTFATALGANAAYAVTVQAQPANQQCTVTNGSGSVANAAVTNVVVACETVRASATIGASGGTVLGPDGVVVEIPAGALAADTVIAVARSSAGAPPAPSESLVAERIYEFTPHDLVFAQPVTIRMPAPGGTETPTIMMASPGLDWSEVDASIAGGTATIVRDTFSWGASYPCLWKPAADPPDSCVTSRGRVALTATPTTALTFAGTTQAVRSWRVSEAATVRFRLTYRVPRSCTGATARVRRAPLNPNGGLAAPIATIFEQPAPLVFDTRDPPFQGADGVTTFDVTLDDASNGRWYYSSQLSCTRNGQVRTYGTVDVIEVNVAPPAVTYSIGGTVAGLSGTGLVLRNNGGDDLPIAADGPFTFATNVAAGGPYSVTVAAQPANPAQTCSVQNANGTAQAAVTNVVVGCAATAARSWRTPALIEANGQPESASPLVGFDAAGNAIAVWVHEQRAPVTLVLTSEVWANRYTRAGGWGTATRIAEVADGNVETLNLAVHANGDATAVWGRADANGDDIVASRYAAGAGWSTPAPIETLAAEARDVRAAFDASGTGFAVWRQKTGPAATEDIWANRYVPGAGWGTPVLLEQSDDGASEPQIAVSANGDAIAIWQQTGNGVEAARYTAAGGWGAAATIPATFTVDSEEMAIAMDDAGNAIVVFLGDGANGFVRAVRYGNGWGSIDVMRNAGYPSRPRIAMRGNYEALIVWREGESGDEVWARPYGSLLGTAETVASSSGGRKEFGAAFAPDGTALVVWNDGTGRRLLARRFTPDATPTYGAPIEVATGVEASEPAIAFDADGNASAVWRQAAGASQYDVAANAYR